MIEAALQFAGLLAGLLFIYALGYGLLALICPAPRGLSALERLPLSFSLGSVILTLWMLTLSSLGVPFSYIPVMLPPMVLVSAGLLLKGYFLRPSVFFLSDNRKPKTENRITAWDWLFLGLLAVLFLFAGLRAGLYPLWSWDALSTWGLKAKVFALNLALNFQGYEAHNYYPNLVPLLVSYLYLMMGWVNDHLVNLLFPWWGALLLALLSTLLLRMGLNRRRALGLATFFALSGVTFIIHLYIAYADLPLAFFTLGAAGLIYLRLTAAAPPGSLPLIGFMCAGMAWSKFEGPPLAATIILAAALTLVWLRPPRLWRRLAELAWPAGGILLGVLPWRLYLFAHHMEVGTDHILNFYPRQFVQAIPSLLAYLANPFYFGLLWWAAGVSLLLLGRSAISTPRLFLLLFLGGNLVAILLAFTLVPTDPVEFPLYIRATLDRLLLHIAPVAALLVGEGLKALRPAQREAEN